MARKKQHIISDTAQLSALRSPVRFQIVAAIEHLKACSVNEIAPHVGLAPESLYYHIKKLVKAGLVRVKSQRMSGKRMENVYELVSSEITIDRHNRSKAFLDLLGDIYGSVLRSTDRSLRRSLDNEKNAKSGPRKATGLLQRSAHLDRESAIRAREMIVELMAFLKENDNPEGGDLYTMTVVFNLHSPCKSP